MRIFSKRRTEELIRDEDRAQREAQLTIKKVNDDARRQEVLQSERVSKLIDSIIASVRQEYIAKGSVRFLDYYVTRSEELLFENSASTKHVLDRIESEIPGIESVRYYARSLVGSGRGYGYRRSPQISKPYISIFFKKPLR